MKKTIREANNDLKRKGMEPAVLESKNGDSSSPAAPPAAPKTNSAQPSSKFLKDQKKEMQDKLEQVKKETSPHQRIIDEQESKETLRQLKKL